MAASDYKKEAEMRSSVMVMSVVALGLSIGVRDAKADRVVTANETTGQVPSDFSFLSDSVVGSLCNANEDQTACFAAAYTVTSSFINPAFQANGGAAGVNLIDSPSSDNPTKLSDQLYLTVSAPLNGLYTLTWCWDSDLEPDVNICPVPAGITPLSVTEPLAGFTNFTSIFTGPNGPLAAGQWTIQAQSEAVPEPSLLFVIAGGLVVGALYLQKRRLLQP
jgi:hypothetical protein